MNDLSTSLPTLSQDDSASRVLTPSQTAALAVATVLLGGALWINPYGVLYAIFLAVGVVYLLSIGFKLLLVTTAVTAPREIHVADAELRSLDRQDLPTYTVLCPMYKEAAVLPKLLGSLSRLDYPVDRLDIKLLLEADDTETIAAAQACRLPPSCEILLVPPGKPRGKPRACNYGLAAARGEYLVIYDAEDLPEPTQLKKALYAFTTSPSEVACVQAKLNYFNSEQNLLTRLFTAEYSMWFDLYLPGLWALELPIPLGGTSNHIKVNELRRIGGWDAWNVTEDADLGLRLHRRGYRTVVLDSTTWEEATSGVHNWIRQRSRWVKGYAQTWLVHMRQPGRLLNELGTKGFIGFQLMYLGTFFTLMVNPIFWALTALWLTGSWDGLDALFTGPAWAMGALSFYVGNFALIFMMMAGCLLRGWGALVKYVLLTPGYWVMMSVGAWKGLTQLVHNPFYWEKTQHGFFPDELARLPSSPASQTANVESAQLNASIEGTAS